MLKKTIFSISLLALLLVATIGKSQPYKTAIGLRLGGISSGITLKHFVSATGALEGIASFGRHAFLITGLYESHHAFPTAEGLSWFYGGGLHVGLFSEHYRYYDFYYKSHGNKVVLEKAEELDYGTSIGADFIIGMDYKFAKVPIDLSIDVKPFVDLSPGVYGYWEGALSFRFTF